MDDAIIISGLEVRSHIGVPLEEREKKQRLTVSLTLFPTRGFANLDDEIENTVDYAAVCDAVTAEAGRKSRMLVETLAEDIASTLLERFALSAVEIEVRKFILPATEYVAVRIRRPAV